MSQQGCIVSRLSLGFDVSSTLTENGEAIDLREEILSTSMFDEIVGSSEARVLQEREFERVGGERCRLHVFPIEPPVLLKFAFSGDEAQWIRRLKQ